MHYVFSTFGKLSRNLVLKCNNTDAEHKATFKSQVQEKKSNCDKYTEDLNKSFTLKHIRVCSSLLCITEKNLMQMRCHCTC